LPKPFFFQRAFGVYIKLVEIPEVLKNGNSGEEKGTSMKFPLWWGYGFFLELHNAALL